MIKPAYYNEFDPWAAQDLRNLIAAGHIAPGDVDTRSIEDVKPDDLRPYTQCHFFAGVGVWSAALRKAGWPDDRRVWTGSCPCQPFSSAGEGNGFADERHLWPAFYHLIGQLEPERIYGEQVAPKAVDPWVDLVHADMEALDYAFGCIAFPSAGVGAPHIRDRAYWMADANLDRRKSGREVRSICAESNNEYGGSIEWLGDPNHSRPQGHAGHDGAAGRGGSSGSVAAAGVFGGLADSGGQRYDGRRTSEASDGGDTTRFELERLRDVGATGPTNGRWRNADWLLCRDGKWRPVEPGTFPLAHGAAARVGRLRAYGNAINLEAAYEFIMATKDY